MMHLLSNKIEHEMSQAEPAQDDVRVLALAGQPNVGKSTVFNRLTGLSQHVGNWPGKTVEQKSGTFVHNEQSYTLLDLPGTYSLTANSEEERIARDFIIREKPTLVLAVVDAAILERSLYLLAELLLLPAPVILLLNMIDVAEQEGIQVEPDVLSAALGIPVIPMCATRNRGYEILLETIEQMVGGEIAYNPRRPTIRIEHQEILAELITLVADWVPEFYPIDWVALKLLEGDEEIASLMQSAMPPDRWALVHALLYQHEDAILDIAGARYEWIARMMRAAVLRPRVGQMGLTARLDRVLTHPIAGTAVLLGVLAGVFWLTYALGSPLQVWLDNLLGGLAVLIRAMLSNNMPVWMVDLVTDGVLGGAGMVFTFLPILIIFFAVLGFLEDTGYMARAAYLTDRFMHMMGLHGKSFIPLLLGFGCNVPAILGTRIIDTRRARVLTTLLAPFVPCTARMAVIAVLAPIFFGRFAGLVAWGLVAMNLILLSLVGLLFHRFVLRGEHAVFIMELPLYHLPNPRTIGLYVLQNIVAFLQKAGTVILLASVLIWGLSYFPTGDVMTSYLATIGQWMEPVSNWMGLPWPFMIALLASFVAKENTIATLAILYGDINTVLPQVLTPPAALGLLVAQMLFIPCVATVATIKQEVGWKWMFVSVLMLLLLSLGVGGLVYQLGHVLYAL